MRGSMAVQKHSKACSRIFTKCLTRNLLAETCLPILARDRRWQIRIYPSMIFLATSLYDLTKFLYFYQNARRPIPDPSPLSLLILSPV